MKLLVALVLVLSIAYGFGVPAEKAAEIENDKLEEDDVDDDVEPSEDKNEVSEESVEPEDDVEVSEEKDVPSNNPSGRRRRRRRRRSRRRRVYMFVWK